MRVTGTPFCHPGIPIPYNEVAHAWQETLAGIHHIAEVLEETDRPDPMEYMHVVVKKTDRLDIKQVEAILFHNDLLDPLKRIDDGTNVEWQGEFRWFTRREHTVHVVRDNTLEIGIASPVHYHVFLYLSMERR